MRLFEEIRSGDFYEVFGLSYNDGSFLESLLHTSSIQYELECLIHKRLYSNTLTQEEGERIISMLKLNQRDSIDCGYRYTATDIQIKLNKFNN